MHIAGVDEVGRGPLAGPVVAAAVILDPKQPIEGLNDSKKITEKQRDRLDIEIKELALCWALGRAEVAEIDGLNILQASLLAMQRAVEALSIVPDQVEVDGNRPPILAMPVTAIIGGDGLIPAISAASIIAKVARDAEMVALAQLFPQYGFERHKGYGTKAHLAALAEHGPTPHHRHSFAPVRKALAAA